MRTSQAETERLKAENGAVEANLTQALHRHAELEKSSQVDANRQQPSFDKKRKPGANGSAQ